MVYAGTINAMGMSSSWLIKILYLLWMTQCHAVATDKQQFDCGKVETKFNISCQGQDITLQCPENKPWMRITTASFARKFSEERVCARPKNSSFKNSSNVKKCEQNSVAKVEKICANKVKCVFNVNNKTFHDPCPEIYKYMLVEYECGCRRRRYTRATTCFQREIRSTTYTTINPTPTLTTITQTMSHNITKFLTNSTYAAIRTTIKPSTTALKSSLTIKATSSVGTKMAPLLPKYKRNKVFFLILELFVIYNEAANEDPPMALMWCFIGMLLGLFIITMVFLFLGLREKTKNKSLFRLSQLETEEEIQSPTIQTTPQFTLESPDSGSQIAVEKLNGTSGNNGLVNKNFPGMGSWSDLLKAETSLYINPLWRGLREGYLGLTAQGEDTDDVDTIHDDREELSRSEPWNINQPAENYEMDQYDAHSSCNVDSSKNENSNVKSSKDGDKHNRTRSDSQVNVQGKDDNISNAITTSNNNNQVLPSTHGKSEFKSSTSIGDPSGTNKRRSAVESDPNLIPVGILSHPVPNPKIFHTEPTRIKKPEICHEKPETSGDNEEEEPVISSRDCKNPPNNLLSKFGIDMSNTYPTTNLSNTALSSPCLLIDDQSTSEKHDQKDSSYPVTSSALKVRSRPLRSRSLDSYSLPQPTQLNNTYITQPNTAPNNPKPNNNDTHNPTMPQHQNQPPFFVKNKTIPSPWPKIVVDDKTNTENLSELSQNQPVVKRQTKKSPGDSRASSGYYSNNTSPLVEYSAEISDTQNTGKKTKQKLQRQSSLKRQTSLNSDDDLPPLPPPPLPLIPISPLPHMCVRGYREAKTKDENNIDKNPARTAGRKVHFKSSN